MPINLGYTKTGRTWPGELEVSRLDAPAEQLAVDPALPILGKDPKFDSDQVVIGRGRLVGLKRDANTSGTDIKTTTPHISYVTVADGVNVAPLGYASHAICKDWQTKANGTRPEISRNYLIALPYVSALNGAYGALKQGDKVTAYFGSKTALYGDPRYKGAVVKWLGRQVYTIRAAGSGATDLTGDGSTLPQGYSGIKPRVIAVFTAAGADVAVSSIDWDATNKKWTVTLGATAATTTIMYDMGQGAEMIAGDVWGMEGLTDMDGFLRWVSDNFGAWDMPRAYADEGNSSATTGAALKWVAPGVVALNVSGTNPGTLIPKRIDAARPIVLKVATANKVYTLGADGSTLTAMATGAVVPAATFVGADYTQGQYYTVNPVTGVINLFGLYNSDGTPFSDAYTTGGQTCTALTLDYYAESLSPEPAYGAGLYGLSSGDGSAPLQFTADTITNDAAIGVMRVAIR